MSLRNAPQHASRLTLIALQLAVLASCQTTGPKPPSASGQSLLDSFRSAPDGYSFVEYWMDQAAGQPGLATITGDLRTGSFQIVIRRVLDDRTLAYEVFEREHRSEPIEQHSFVRHFRPADNLSAAMDRVIAMIEAAGSADGLEVKGGPSTKNHLAIKSGRNIAVPFAGFDSSYYTDLETAAYSIDETADHRWDGAANLTTASIEILINQIDSTGRAEKRSPDDFAEGL